MSDGPRLTESRRAAQAARAERLARALRDNLCRRKEQARQRTADATAEEAAATEPDGGKPPA